MDGWGAASSPGRWNERNHRATYLASSVALGILEVLVQANTASLDGYRFYPVGAPDDAVVRLEVDSLTPTWRQGIIGRAECRMRGEAWRASAVSLGLAVPSAVVPEAHSFGEFNVVLNPEHVDFGRLKIHDPVALETDARLKVLLASRERPRA